MKIIDEILQGDMWVSKYESWKIPTGMLMELYRYHGYASKDDVLKDGGVPQKLRVTIQISLEEMTPT